MAHNCSCVRQRAGAGLGLGLESGVAVPLRAAIVPNAINENHKHSAAGTRGPRAHGTKIATLI